MNSPEDADRAESLIVKIIRQAVRLERLDQTQACDAASSAGEVADDQLKPIATKCAGR